MTTTAPTTPDIAGTLKKNPHTALVKDGIDEFGLYVEFVTFHVGGTMRDYHRRLYTRDMISWYRRPVSQSRTTWKATKPANGRVDAAADLEAIMNAQRGVMIGSPILVQLDEADRATIAKNCAPGARFRAAGLHERIYGKFDPNTFTAPSPAKFNDTNVDVAVKVTEALVGAPLPEATITVAPAGTVPGGPTSTPWTPRPVTLTVEEAAAMVKPDRTTPIGRAIADLTEKTEAAEAAADLDEGEPY